MFLRFLWDFVFPNFNGLVIFDILSMVHLLYSYQPEIFGLFAGYQLSTYNLHAAWIQLQSLNSQGHISVAHGGFGIASSRGVDERFWPQNGGHGWGTTFQNQHEILQFEDPLNKLSAWGFRSHGFFNTLSIGCPFQKVTFCLGWLGVCFFSTKDMHWRIQVGQRICMGVDFIPTKRAHNLHISTPIH